MSKYSLTIVLMLLAKLIFAQTTVNLNVKHTLGTKPFELNKSIVSSLGNEYTITRLDYFISNIKLYHDGISSSMPDTYILVRNGIDFTLPLGTFSLHKLDSISFYIGIDSLTNHGDPAIWKADHALALKSPEMHWGWSGGYRFVALEGKNAASPNGFQIHALGDPLLTRVVVETSGLQSSGALTIPIYADLGKATDGLDMSQTIWEHGLSKEATVMLGNFGNRVFTSSAVTSSAKDIVIVKSIEFSDNPLIQNTITMSTNDGLFGLWSIKNSQGMIIYRSTEQSIDATIDINVPGVYLVEKSSNGRISHQGRFVKL